MAGPCKLPGREFQAVGPIWPQKKLLSAIILSTRQNSTIKIHFRFGFGPHIYETSKTTVHTVIARL